MSTEDRWREDYNREARRSRATEPPFDARGGAIPKAPPGYRTCNVHDGDQRLIPVGATRQVNHLVAVPTSGPTLCGLTRFGDDADLPSWSMGGGVWGRDVMQAPCITCWESANGS